MPLASFASPESSNIVGASYDSDTRELRVTFKGNRTYLYRGFPADMWEQFRSADSKGGFFGTSIKFDYKAERL